MNDQEFENHRMAYFHDPIAIGIRLKRLHKKVLYLIRYWKHGRYLKRIGVIKKAF